MKKISVILLLLIMLSLLQIIRMTVTKIFLLFIPTTELSIMLINMAIFILYIYILIYINKKMDLKIFVKENKKSYITLSIILSLLLLLNVIMIPFSMYNIISILYVILVVPIFEELLFRGYIWNRINKIFNSEMVVCVLVTILFAIWNLGYIDSIKLNNDISIIILSKVIIGLIYGVCTGIVRYKTRNTYSSILVHSIMNMFTK